MSFDCSRFTFDSWNDFFGVVMEQGKVQLDSDWNEWLAEFARRIQAGTVDTVGRAVYPATTPYGFKISTDSKGNITIGAGRMYVDGLLAENHGTSASKAAWDPVLAELSNTPPGAPAVYIPYTGQPYQPNTAAQPASGTCLFYLDVWRRAVTYLQYPDLVEKAVGIDTTGRLQTVWQVKFLPVDASVNCSTADTDIPAWETLLQPSAARLTTGLGGPAGDPGPCCLTPTTGYTGMENQLYRVEIHQGTKAGGPQNGAMFKWSRDNASVATAVSAVSAAQNSSGAAASQLNVQSTGRDNVLCFSPGNWIEITDDYLELGGQPGELHQIDVNGVDSVNNIITLRTAVSAGFQERITKPPSNYPNVNTRIVRWDQGGTVYQSDGQTPWVDLDTSNTGGLIQVPPEGTSLILENGIVVSFSENPEGGTFNPGDFWTFAARSTDGSVEVLTDAPPQGIHHHYARLSVVTFPATAVPSDCRIAWPPPSGGASCGCTVIVQQSDITASNTLQDIITNNSGQATATVVCLQPGTYSLPGTLRFPSGQTNITLSACQDGTVELQAQTGQEGQFVDGLIALDGANNVTLSGLQLFPPLTPYVPTQFAGVPIGSLDAEVSSALSNLYVSIGVRAVNCIGFTMENCEVGFPDMEEDPPPNATPFGVGVFAGGACSNWQLTGNTFAGDGPFLAGFLQAPTVLTWNSPPAANPFPTGRFNAAGLIDETGAGTFIKDLAAAPAPAQAKRQVAKAKASRKAAAAQPSAQAALVTSQAGQAAPAAPETSQKDVVTTQVNPAQEASFILRENHLFQWGTSMAYTAAYGGTVLASSLDEAVFEGNLFDGMTVAALIYGECQTVAFTDNDVEGCQAGFWLLSPQQAGLAVYDKTGLALIGLSAAMGYPLPNQPSAPAPQAATVPAAPQPIRIYPGTTAQQDSSGNTWSPDASYVSGTTGTYTVDLTKPNTDDTPVADGTDPFLYASERNGPKFSYTFSNLPLGNYQVTLKFAEIWYLTPADSTPRIFNVSINNTQYLAEFDIYSDSGGPLTPDDKVFANIIPVQGQIVIQFQVAPDSKDPNAKISAVEVLPQWSGIAPTSSDFQPLPNTTFVNFFSQLSQMAQQAYASPSSPLQLRLTDNELHGLSSITVLVLWSDQLQNGNVSSLMMTGNRMDTQPSFENSDLSKWFIEWERAASDPESTAAETGLVPVSFFNFAFAANISFVTRCVISGNMILNQYQGGAFFRPSLLVNDAAVPEAVATVSPPEIVVSGNVLQGQPLILPSRFGGSGAGVPLVLRTWNILNSISS